MTDSFIKYIYKKYTNEIKEKFGIILLFIYFIGLPLVPALLISCGIVYFCFGVILNLSGIDELTIFWCSFIIIYGLSMFLLFEYEDYKDYKKTHEKQEQNIKGMF